MKHGWLNLGNFGFQFLRQKLANSVYLKKFLYKIYWEFPEFCKPQNRIRTLLLDINMRKKGKVYFVNIGANDGLSGDPLGEFVFRYKWRGIMVEPVPYVFERLKKVYKNTPGVVLEKKAISTRNGKKDFWHLKKTKELGSGYDQLGSFDKKLILNNMKNWNFSGGQVVKSVVKCSTLEKLLIKNRVIKVDVFSIDVEGYDYQVIKQINFEKIEPELIFFEYAYLNPDEKEKCFSLLKEKGYIIEDIGDQITGIAIRQ